MTVQYYFSEGITLFEKITLLSCNIFSRKVTPRGLLIRFHEQQYTETTEGMLPKYNKIFTIDICCRLNNIWSLVLIIKHQNM